MRRRSSIDLVFEQSRKTQPPVPDAAQQTAAKDWKATVAERLERQQRKESREGSVANTMPSVDTATEHIWERRHTSTEAGANGMAGPPQSVPATELTRDLLLELEWKRFELLVARYFAATGMRAELTKTGADGGVDIYIYEEREGGPCGFVQCKAHGPDKFIVAEQVRALFGVMMAARVSRGFFVTTAQFGKEALAFAAQNGIEAIDGHELLTRFSRLEPEAKARIVSEVTAGDYRTPTCPTHDVKMVLRNRKANGVAFWACARPGCKRIINVRG